MIRQLPTGQKLSSYLERLLGKPVRIEKTDDLEWNSRYAYAVGAYRNRDRQIAVSAVCDFELLAVVGGALTLTPTKVIEHSIENRVPEAHLVEAAQEVLNVLAACLNECASEHVSLKELYRKQRPLPPEATKFLQCAQMQRSWSISVDGCGDGKLSFVC